MANLSDRAGAPRFDALIDTPSSKTGQAGKVLAVNSGETALEYVDQSGGGGGGATGTFQEIDASTDDNFTSGTIFAAKTGNIVAISGNVQHASASSVTSASNIIPSTMLPFFGASNDYGTINDGTNEVQRTAMAMFDGKLAFKYFLQDGTPSAQSTSDQFTITYAYKDTSNRQTWDPTQVSTSIWYDSADTSTVTTSGANVTEWASKGTLTVSQTQNTSGDFPQYGNSITRNGNQYVRFESGQYMLANAAGGGFISGQAGMMVLCVQPFNTSDGRRFINNNASNFFFATFQSSYNVWLSGRTNGPTVADAPIACIIVAKDSANSGASLWVNGTNYSTTLSISVFANELNMGRNAADSWPRCEYYELLSVPFNNSGTRQQIEGYLAWKWAFVDRLPANHPYKRIPPLV